MDAATRGAWCYVRGTTSSCACAARPSNLIVYIKDSNFEPYNMSTLPLVCDARDSEFHTLEIVAHASECHNCENGICEDPVSLEPVTFPAWRNTTTGTCWSRETVRGVVGDNAHPRDPLSGRRWNIPPDKWDVSEVIELRLEGLHEAAVSLFDRTLALASAWRVGDIIGLHSVGMCSEAEKLRKFTEKLARWNIDEVIALHEVGLCRAAWVTHLDTLMYVTSWSASDVTVLHTAGLFRQSRSLFEWTLTMARWSVPEIITMHRRGPSQAAHQLFGTTLKYSVWDEGDVTLLREAGLQAEANKTIRKSRRKLYGQSPSTKKSRV